MLEHLSDIRHGEKGNEGFEGIIKLGEHRCKLELRVYPRECRPYALLYLTGSADFNRGMRQEAKRQGLLLSDTALRNADTLEEIHCDSEEDVFKFIGMEYKRPEDRGIY